VFIRGRRPALIRVLPLLSLTKGCVPDDKDRWIITMRNQAPGTTIDETLVRIVIIDDQELFRAGVRLLLSGNPAFDVLAATSATDALAVVKRLQPDVVLLGADSADGKNLDWIPQIFTACESTRVLVLAGSSDPELNRRAVCLGAIGIISKDKSPDTLLKAVERVHAGEAWLDRSLTATILRDLAPATRSKKADPDEMKIESLTEREREVIRHVGAGLKTRQIAERLFISEITVHHHLTSIYGKLEVADRLELLIYAYRNGLADLPR
jgi:two-component system nitrate/nitrite response regulator NarL